MQWVVGGGAGWWSQIVVGHARVAANYGLEALGERLVEVYRDLLQDVGAEGGVQ